MSDNVVEVYFIATDEISSTVSRMSATVDRNMSGIKNTSQALNELSDRQENARKHADALDRQWNKLTSSTDFLAGGVKKFRNLLEGIVWGSAIGAASALVTELTSLAIAAFDTSEKIDRIAKSIQDADNAMANAGKRYTVELRARMQELSETMEAIRQVQSQGVFVPPEKIAQLTQQFNLLNKELSRMELPSQAELAKKTQESWKWFSDVKDAEQKANQLRLDNRRKFNEQMAAYMADLKEKELRFIQEGFDKEQQARDRANQNAIANAQFEQNLRDRINANELANAQFQARLEEAKRQQYENTFITATQFADAIFIFSGQKSKAMFNIYKAFAIAEAIASTYLAANRVLAETFGGPEVRFAAAAATIAYGLANVARISSMSMTGASGGGGAGASSVSTLTTPGPGQTESQARPIEVHIEINSAVTDKHTLDDLANQILPSIGRIIQDRGGNAGPINIQYNRP